MTKRDSTGSKLRAAIFASPDDDAPRLVYADWLLERGDPLGEFIQIQCMLGRAITGSLAKVSPNHAMGANRPTKSDRDAESRKALELREQALLREHQKTWIAPIRGFINSWFWERGFVSRVDVNVKKLVAHYAAILDVAPLRAVYLMGCTPAAVRQFSQHPLVGSLRSVAFDMQRISVREADIFRSPHFAKLQELSLRRNPIDDDARRSARARSLVLRPTHHFARDRELGERGVLLEPHRARARLQPREENRDPSDARARSQPEVAVVRTTGDHEGRSEASRCAAPRQAKKLTAVLRA
jgi:uncharacterized protein (TIGR02996 family)